MDSDRPCPRAEHQIVLDRIKQLEDLVHGVLDFRDSLNLLSLRITELEAAARVVLELKRAMQLLADEISVLHQQLILQREPSAPRLVFYLRNALVALASLLISVACVVWIVRG